MNSLIRKSLILAATILGIFLSIRYLLPLIFPFLIGTALALAAEPIVRFCCSRLHLPRAVASGIGVSMSFAFIAILLLMLAALAAMCLTGCAQESVSLGVIGGADGPTAVFVSAAPFWWVPFVVIAAIAAAAVIVFWRKRK